MQMNDVLTHRPEGSDNGDLASDGRVCEITPEMIEAGVKALIYFEPKFESDAAGAEKIYRAMEEARTSGREPPAVWSQTE